MTHIFYSDEGGYSGPPRNLADVNATKRWLDHASNMLVLKAMEQDSRDAREKAQITKELRICERKMTYWERHQNFVRRDAEIGLAELRRAWTKSRGAPL